MRSRYTRRKSVALSAGPTGVRPFALYSAAMKASIGFWELVTPLGTSGRASGFRIHSRDSGGTVLAGGAETAAGLRGAGGFFSGGAASISEAHKLNDR